MGKWQLKADVTNYLSARLWAEKAREEAAAEMLFRRFLPEPTPPTRRERVSRFFRKYINRVKNAYLALRGY